MGTKESFQYACVKQINFYFFEKVTYLNELKIDAGSSQKVGTEHTLQLLA